MKNLYRRYKISLITNDGITLEEKEIVEFVLDKIKDLTLFIDEDNSHNYMNSKGEWIFEHGTSLYIRYEDFWEVLKIKFLLECEDIQNIVKDVIEQVYKIEAGRTISWFDVFEVCGTENTYEKYKNLLEKNI